MPVVSGQGQIMRGSPFVPVKGKVSRTASRGRAGGGIWIPWHVIRRFLDQHVTILGSDAGGGGWRTMLVASALRWSGRHKRSFRPQYLKMHRFPMSVKKGGGRK